MYSLPGTTAIVLLTNLFLSSFANAHHDVLREIDLNAPIEIVGQVQSLELVSPHAILRIAGKNTNGDEQIWAILLDDPEQLKTMGFTPLSVTDNEWVAVIAFPVTGSTCSPECAAYGLTLSDSDNNDYSLNAQISAELLALKKKRAGR